VRGGLSPLAIQVGVADGGADPSALNRRSPVTILGVVNFKAGATGHRGILDIRSRPMREVTVVDSLSSAWAERFIHIVVRGN
jgi:hypothetical protein